MQPRRSKTCYHPYLLVAFHLNCLPDNMLQIIPRSTRFDWDKRDLESSFGYDWFLENKDLFQALQLIAINRKLLKINRALFRVIAISRFMKVNAVGIKASRNLLKSVVVQNIKKVAATVGIKQALKFIDLNFKHYANLRTNITCVTSVLNLCRIKHPAQLIQREINMVKSYCQEFRYQFCTLCTLF